VSRPGQSSARDNSTHARRGLSRPADAPRAAPTVGQRPIPSSRPHRQRCSPSPQSLWTGARRAPESELRTAFTASVTAARSVASARTRISSGAVSDTVRNASCSGWTYTAARTSTVDDTAAPNSHQLQAGARRARARTGTRTRRSARRSPRSQTPLSAHVRRPSFARPGRRLVYACELDAQRSVGCACHACASSRTPVSRTTITGRSALATTPRDVLLRNAPLNGPSPRLPITIRSASMWRASRRICVQG
jgi:hypothetical protein